MLRYLIGRVPSVLGVLFITSVVAFALPRLASGNPAAAVAGPDANPEFVEAIRAEMNLDRPVVTQYVEWITGALHGDLGHSFVSRQPVSTLISDRLGSTLELAALASILMVVLGLALGIASAMIRTGPVRIALNATNTALLASPPFLTGLLLILLFGLRFPIFPVSGEVSIFEDPWLGFKYLLLPSIALALPQAAAISRLLASSMIATGREDFIDLAKAKGAGTSRIVRRHLLRNSFAPALVMIGLRLGQLLAGAIVIEAIFGRHGVGSLAITAVQSRDYLVIQALILGAVFIAVLLQLLTEVGVAVLDPRVRLGDES